MSARRRICVVTGTRAEYGLLYWPMRMIRDDGAFELQVIATGMHLSPEFGMTAKTIEDDGFPIDARVEMLLSADTPTAIAKSMGLGTIGFADAFERLHPDYVMLLGDRFELLAAAQAALVAQIPIAHIVGGDVTEGAIDEAIRHSITKMSHLHFVTNAESAKRVRQLGENPAHIFNVGSPGLDHLHRITLLDRAALATVLDFKFRARNVLVTFHPETLERQRPALQFGELLTALDRLGDEVGIVVTAPNADTFGRPLIAMIADFVATHSNAKTFTSLGQLRYLSMLAQVDAVVGNSSSGVYEVPSFKKPTVNIGKRQRGRPQASSVLNCEAEAVAIYDQILMAFQMDCSGSTNPYGDGHSSPRIVEALRGIADPSALTRKHFFDLSAEAESRSPATRSRA